MLEKGTKFHKAVLKKYMKKHVNFENMLNKLLGLKNVIIQKKLKRAIGVYIINKLNKTNTMRCIEQNEQ